MECFWFFQENLIFTSSSNCVAAALLSAALAQDLPGRLRSETFAVGFLVVFVIYAHDRSQRLCFWQPCIAETGIHSGSLPGLIVLGL